MELLWCRTMHARFRMWTVCACAQMSWRLGPQCSRSGSGSSAMAPECGGWGRKLGASSPAKAPAQGPAPGVHAASAGSPGAQGSALSPGAGGSSGSAVAPGDAAAVGKHAGPSGLEGFVVGEGVQFYDKHSKKWKPAMVIKKFPDGSLQISGRCAPLSAAECETRLRRPKASTTSRGSAAQRRTAGPGLHRARGTHDDMWTRVVAQWLVSLKNVDGIFEKLRDSYADTAAMQSLKTTMLQLFPKGDGDYAAFQSAPGASQVRGHIHPCLGASSAA